MDEIIIGEINTEETEAVVSETESIDAKIPDNAISVTMNSADELTGNMSADEEISAEVS